MIHTTRNLNKVIIGDSLEALKHALRENMPVFRTNIHTENWFSKDFYDPSEYVSLYLECSLKGLIFNHNIISLEVVPEQKKIVSYENASFNEYSFEEAFFYDCAVIKEDGYIFYDPHVYKVFWYKLDRGRFHHKIALNDSKVFNWVFLEKNNLYACIEDLYNLYNEFNVKSALMDEAFSARKVQFHRKFKIMKPLYVDREDAGVNIVKHFFIAT